MSLETPEKIRNLQRKLYCKAKAEPASRFYVLYDKICRDDILLHAYRLARVNAGAPGVDGITFAQIEEEGLEAWLAGLREDLVSKTYRPGPVRRVMIPKPNGGERPLGIPTIRDRVVQSAPKSCWSPSSKPTSRTRLTATVPNAGRWTRSRRCTGISAGATLIRLTPTYPSASIRSRTRSFSNRWPGVLWTETCCASSRCG
jgi:RNA-directed DNA polymerase